MMNVRGLILAVFVGGIIGGIILLAWRPIPISGQQNFPEGTRKTACGCFCGGTSPAYFVFKDDNCAGILAADACNRSFAGGSAAQLAAMCRRARAGRPGPCPVLDEICGERDPAPDPECKNPKTPWYDRSTPCTDVEAPQITVVGAEVKLSVCGFPIFRWKPRDSSPLLLETYVNTLTEYVTRTTGSKICCTSFRNSIKTGVPCNAAVDIDCDGKPNETDIDKTFIPNVDFPAIDLYTTPAGANIDPIPFGLNPDDPDFMPQRTARDSKGVGDCLCKWELIKGELKCSPDGKQQHVYTATWRCPTTKAEVFTTKYAPATSPCKIFKQTGSADLFFDYLESRPASFAEFLPVALRYEGCGL